jgi:hypothetical protein
VQTPGDIGLRRSPSTIRRPPAASVKKPNGKRVVARGATQVGGKLIAPHHRAGEPVDKLSRRRAGREIDPRDG